MGVCRTGSRERHRSAREQFGDGRALRRRARRATCGTTPSGPATVAHVASWRTPRSRRRSRAADRLDERHRQPPSASGDEPHRHVDRRARRRRRARSRSTRRRCRSSRPRPRAATRSARRMAASIASGSDRLDVDAGSIHRPHEPAAVVAGDHRQHRHVAARGAAPAPRSPGSRRSSPRRRRGARSASRAGVAVALDLVGETPRRVERRPAWRAGGRTATTAARTSGCARRGCGTAARARSAPDASRSRASTVSATIDRRVDAAAPGDVAEPLHRMHGAHLARATALPSRRPGPCYRRTSWPRTHPPTWCSPRSAARRGRCPSG